MLAELEAVVISLLSVLRTEVVDYCDIETIDDNVLVANDGSLATVIRILGVKTLLSSAHFQEIAQRLEGALTPFMRSRGHQIQVVFRRDIDPTELLNEAIAPQKDTAAYLNLDVVDLVDETADKLSAYLYDETLHCVLWSRPLLLDPAEARIDAEEKRALAKQHKLPALKNAQNPLRPVRFLYDRHIGFVRKVVEDLRMLDFMVDEFDVHGMVRAIKRSVYPDSVDPRWKPQLPGDRPVIRWKKNANRRDASELLPPSIAQQVMTLDAEIGRHGNPALPDPNTVRLGARVFAPVLFELPPNEPKTFTALFNDLNKAETVENGRKRSVPYALSFMLEGDGMSVLGLKTVFSSILGFTSEQNRNLNSAAKALGEFRRDGGTLVKLRISALTWARLGEDKELSLRKRKLIKSLEAWGGGKVVEKSGHPLLAFQSTAVGLSYKHIGNPAAAPLYDAVYLLPLTRPTSPFKLGSTLYRSLDGKLMRYQRFSSDQSTWITLIAGKPGSGKSVMMNSNNVDSCLMPGLTRLPYICIIDIGISSAGFIDLIADALPKDRKHLAVYKRIQNTADYAINPFDTHIGLRTPLPRDRQFLINFLVMLATPPERDGVPYDGMSGFVGRIVDSVYRSVSDRETRGRPQNYIPGLDQEVDEAIERARVEIRQATKWWDIVDALFDAGDIYGAQRAQRYAVPTLDIAIGIAATPDIQEDYGDRATSAGQSLPRLFMTMISEAINDYPIFSKPTSFDLGESRVMSLDLQDVVQVGSAATKKQAALMYMIARQSFLKKVAISREDTALVPPRYLAHYTRLTDEIAEDYKVICYDEFHKTGGHAMLQEQIMTDGREARKWNLEIVLASQILEDFGGLSKIATSIFILDSGTEQTRQYARDTIGLSEVENSALQRYVTGANKDGATMLARFVTKTKQYSHLFTLTCGAKRLWALSTTAEDRKLRSLLYRRMGTREARELLAKRFPSGSCKAYLERMRENLFNQSDFLDEEQLNSAVEELANQLVAEYLRDGQ